MTLSDSRPAPPSDDGVEAATLVQGGSPPITRITLPACRAHYPGGPSGCICRLLPHPRGLPRNSGGSASTTVTFEACSGFTRVTARRIAQPPKAAFVTRLRPARLPSQAARQLPDQPTTLWVEPSSTGDARRLGALPLTDILHSAATSAANIWSRSLGVPHSITSSAAATRLGGTVRPSAFAVPRLTTSAYRVGA